jgi:hypothetical protein
MGWQGKAAVGARRALDSSTYVKISGTGSLSSFVISSRCSHMLSFPRHNVVLLLDLKT